MYQREEKTSCRVLAILLAVNVVALLLAAAWFRCRSLGNIPGINGDEAWYGVTAWELLHHGRPSLCTPTGNLLNPLFFAPLLLLQAFCSPSIIVLRSVSVLSGLLALVVNWLLCRWVFDRATAVVSTLALALLPINIAYSRFAWDASQSLLVTLPVLYFSVAAVRFPARQDRLLAFAILAMLPAILVHPTNIFAAVPVGVVLAMQWRRFRFNARSIAVVVLVGLTLALWAATRVKAPGALDSDRHRENIRQLACAQHWAYFTELYGGLFSGETTYQFISGAHSWLQWPELGGNPLCVPGVALPWAALLAAAWILWRKAAWDQSPTPAANTLAQDDIQRINVADRMLVAVWLLQLAAFLVVAGPDALMPDQTRFAICLIGPAVLLVSRGAVAWAMRLRPVRLLAIVLALAACWFVLADFQQHYFRFIEQTGGRAHRTFRTAAVEPKLAALDYVLDHRGAGVTWIMADEWWSYWPLRYLSMGQPDIDVVMHDEAISRPDFAAAQADGRLWHVEFIESQPPGRRAQEQQILDYGGRPVLSVRHGD
jgi:hypothetical protein